MRGHTKNAEIALLVAEQLQRQGLGTELVRRLIQVGRIDELVIKSSTDRIYTV